MERKMFFYKNAMLELAKNFRHASHPTAAAVFAGVFLPDGSFWNIVFGAATWLSMQGTAFFIQAWADGMPNEPP